MGPKGHCGEPHRVITERWVKGFTEKDNALLMQMRVSHPPVTGHNFLGEQSLCERGAIRVLIPLGNPGMMIPKSHPRYESLMLREKISQGLRDGIVHETGLIAHGRGEAYDYLLGEQTIPPANMAERMAAALLLCAKKPVISVNGNVAALAAKECCNLADTVRAKLEVNLFHYDVGRMKKITELLYKNGARDVLGLNADKRIPGLGHPRGMCCSQGIYRGDVIVVPLEDGDRCQALRNMGKTVVAIDLNPLSRTARAASVTIVDNVIRALPRITEWTQKLEAMEIQDVLQGFDNSICLQEALDYISHRLTQIPRSPN